MFVNSVPVPVSDGSGNTICIRPKMDFGAKAACMDALTAVGQGKGGKAAVSMHLGAYQIALMQHNIVSWSGPAFVGIACTPENIARLDPDEPLVDRVLEEIGKRNPLNKHPDMTEEDAAKAETAEKKDDMSGGGQP